MIDHKRTYQRQVLRSAFQSLFWNVLLTRKRQFGFTFKALADALSTNKSYVSRSFSTPPNWQIDKIADMAEALGVDVIVEARDRKSGVIYTVNSVRPAARPNVADTETKIEREGEPETATGAPERQKPILSAVI